MFCLCYPTDAGDAASPTIAPTQADLYAWTFTGIYADCYLECTSADIAYKVEIYNCCHVVTLTLVDGTNCDASTKSNVNAIARTSAEVPECDSDCGDGVVTDDEICDTNGEALCIHNPSTGSEYLGMPQKIQKKQASECSQHILIIGADITCLECARILKICVHNVSLHETSKMNKNCVIHHVIISTDDTLLDNLVHIQLIMVKLI